MTATEGNHDYGRWDAQWFDHWRDHVQAGFAWRFRRWLKTWNKERLERLQDVCREQRP